MSTIEPHRGGALSSLALLGMGAITAAAFAAPQSVPLIAGVVLVLYVMAAFHSFLLAWPSLLAFLLIIILVVPIRRYRLPSGLPFELEPYRLVAAFLIVAWVTSLLIDERVRLRPSGFETPLALVAIATFGSVVANGGQIAASGIQDHVMKNLMFFISFMLIFYILVSLVRTRQEVESILKVIVVFSAIVAAAGIVQARARFNIFDHLGVLPLLQEGQFLDVENDPAQFARSIYGRVYASAEHPISFGAAMMLGLPLALYFSTSGSRRWVYRICAGLILLGMLSSVSRTPVIMLGAALFTYLLWRPSLTLRYLPIAAPVAAVVIHFALPTTLGTIKSSFFPEGGLLSQQRTSEGSQGQGRLLDLGDAFAEVRKQPVLGEGYAARVVDPRNPDPLQILDNQWLGILLSTGILGFLSWLWVVGRFIRRTSRVARDTTRLHSSLAMALGVAIVAAAVGMLTFDAFAFVQWTFLFFVLVACGAVVLRLDAAHEQSRVVSSVAPPSPSGSSRLRAAQAPRGREP